MILWTTLLVCLFIFVLRAYIIIIQEDLQNRKRWINMRKLEKEKEFRFYCSILFASFNIYREIREFSFWFIFSENHDKRPNWDIRKVSFLHIRTFAGDKLNLKWSNKICRMFAKIRKCALSTYMDASGIEHGIWKCLLHAEYPSRRVYVRWWHGIRIQPTPAHTTTTRSIHTIENA